MRLSKLLFDIDGTIVLLPIDWPNVISRTRTEGVNTTTFLGFVARYYGTDVFWRIHRYLELLELEAVDNLVVLDNAEHILKRICQRIDVGFITMQSRAAAEKILSKLGIDKCNNNLGILSTREDSSTRIEQVSKAVKTMNVLPSEVLFIGDKLLDAIAAIINGVKSIIVLRNLVSNRISDTDYIDEDLEVVGVRIAKNLWEALKIAENFYGLHID
jgi:phosphoglycolate phosphatase-like HAD superfamily hydrolase